MNDKLNEYEKVKKAKENNMLRLIIIVALSVVLIMGKTDIKQSTAETPASLTLPRKDNLVTFKDDLLNYVINVNKTGVKNAHELTKGTVEKIADKEKRLNELKAEEKQLQTLINNVPTTVYEHNKLDLSAFMVEELKENGLQYAIQYNYDLTGGTDENGEPTEEGVEGTKEVIEEIDMTEEILNGDVDDAFAIKIYQIDKPEVYNKMMNVLDLIYIKEPYEILKVKMGYDKITEGYFLEFIIGL